MRNKSRLGGYYLTLNVFSAALFAILLTMILVLVSGCGDADESGDQTSPGLNETLNDNGETGKTELLVIGLDGAAWRVFDKLIAVGEAPNMARLVTNGTRGILKSEHPIQSPPIWNTIATGFGREKHGITTFMQDPGNGVKVPVTTRMRKKKAFWNIMSDAGISTGVVAWWPTWPAEHIKGFVVSQRAWPVRFSQNGVPFGATRDKDMKLVIPEFSFRTWPEDLFEDFRPFIMTEETVNVKELERFVGADPVVSKQLYYLVWVYARDTTFFRAGTYFLGKYKPSVFAVYFEGIDVVSHYYWQYRPEENFSNPPDEQKMFGPLVDNYYKYMDWMIGELMEVAGVDVNVVIVSDHGFETKWDLKSKWEKGEEIDVEGGMGVPWTHGDDGIILLAGPAFRKGTELAGASIYDVTPTILPVAGLPVGKDMDGKPLTQAYKPGKVTVKWVETHETGDAGTADSAVDAGSPIDGRFEEKLRSLGYIE